MKMNILALRKQAAAMACLTLTLILAACSGGGGADVQAAVAPPAPPVVAAPPASEPVVELDEGPAPLHVDDSSQVEIESPGVPASDDAPAQGGALAEAGDFAIRGYGPQRSVSLDEEAQFATSDASVASLRPPASTAPPATRLYVSPKGSDQNPGTMEAPLRTLAWAARLARAGTRVLVAPGTYSGPVRSNASGLPDARVVFVSTTKWGARIVPPAVSVSRVAWDNRGSYVDIVGFEVDGSRAPIGVAWTHGIYSGGSWDSIRNNRVHHIAQQDLCSHRGGAAIGIDSYYGGAGSEVVSNLVHDIGPAGCRYIQGIYVSTPGSVKNNVVFRVAEAGIHLWHDARDVIISNNTVMASNTGIVVGGGDFYRSKAGNDRTQVFSNIVVDNKMGISEQGRTGNQNTYANNLVYANARFDWSLRNGLQHRDTISAPPLLVEGAAHGTPALEPDPASPAVGRGNPAFAESTDFDGRPRTAREGYDIGAFQHRLR